jgi:hypothetical protein
MGLYSAAVLADSPFWYFRMPKAGALATMSIGSDTSWWGGAQLFTQQGSWTGVESDAGSILLLGTAGTAQSRAFSATAWTIEFWVYQGGQSSGTVQTTNNYVLLDSAGVTNTSFGVGASGGRWTWTALAGPNSTTTVFFVPGVWHHVALVYTTLATLYVDGASIFTSTAFSQAGYTTARLVGAEVETYPTWLAELALYPVALSSTRIAAHASAVSPTAPVFSTALTSCS